jgi:hypothetical protein
MICPAANDEVIAAIIFVAFCPATRLASCSAVSVTTMKVPPTHSAATMIVSRFGHNAGNAMPAAMIAWDAIHRRRLPMRRASAATASVDSAAASPNTGHDQPNKGEPCKAVFAITGRKVAGMM